MRGSALCAGEAAQSRNEGRGKSGAASCARRREGKKVCMYATARTGLEVSRQNARGREWPAGASRQSQSRYGVRGVGRAAVAVGHTQAQWGWEGTGQVRYGTARAQAQAAEGGWPWTVDWMHRCSERLASVPLGRPVVWCRWCVRAGKGRDTSTYRSWELGAGSWDLGADLFTLAALGWGAAGLLAGTSGDAKAKARGCRSESVDLPAEGHEAAVGFVQENRSRARDKLWQDRGMRAPALGRYAKRGGGGALDGGQDLLVQGSESTRLVQERCGKGTKGQRAKRPWGKGSGQVRSSVKSVASCNRTDNQTSSHVGGESVFMRKACETAVVCRGGAMDMPVALGAEASMTGLLPHNSHRHWH